MPDNLEPRYSVIPEDNADPNIVDQTTPWVDAQAASLRQNWYLTSVNRQLARNLPANPNFNAWARISKDGRWDIASDLAETQSDEEYNQVLQMDTNSRRDAELWEKGPGGVMAIPNFLLAGALDPANLIPIPLAKGIGLFKGFAVGVASNAAVSGVTEALRISADPAARKDEWLSSVALSSLLGGAIGAGSGAWGADAARALRDYELGLSDIDSPNFSLKPRGDENFRFKYERGPQNADGSYSTFKIVDDVVGYEPQNIGGVRYVSQDGVTWTRAAEGARAEPLSVSDDIAEQLGTPQPIIGQVAHVDEAAHKREHLDGQWHDELAGYLPERDRSPIDTVVLDGNDFTNFRTYHDLWKLRLPQLIDESADDWRLRTGKRAMREFRASKASGNYAGGVIGKLMQRMNFSPMVKAINVFKGDNRVAELVTGIGGDYGFATVGAQHGWSAPPSLLLKSLQHVPRLKRFNDAFEAEWLKYASQNQQAKGRQFQSMNVSAAAYALKDGLRRFAGAQVLAKSDFEQMVAEAVFNPNDFSVNGFPVNENARAAAKAFTALAQEYDELHRAAGNFRDQQTLNRDIKYWSKQKLYYEERMMKWLFGETGQPNAYRTAIRVTTAAGEQRIFTGDSFDAAIQRMTDELGDEGITLSERLQRGNYGYVPRGEQLGAIGNIINLNEVRAKIKSAETMAEAEAIMRQMSSDDLYTLQNDIMATDWSQVTRIPRHLEAEYREWLDDAFDGIDRETVEAPENIGETRARFFEEHFERLRDEIVNDNERGMADFENAMEDGPQTGWDLDAAFYDFDNAGDALDYISGHTDDAGFKHIIQRIRSYVGDVSFAVVEPENLDDINTGGRFGKGEAFFAVTDLQDPGIIRVQGEGWPGGGAMRNDIVLHEALHAASYHRIRQGRNELGLTPLGKAVEDLDKLREILQDRYFKETSFDHLRDYATASSDEILTYGLTDKRFRDWMRQTQLPSGETVLSKFVKILRDILGLAESDTNALSRLIELADEILPDQDAPSIARAGPPEGRFGPAESLGRLDESFTDMDTMITQREAGLSPRQRTIYADMKSSADGAAANIAEMTEQLRVVTDNPHQFVNANGRPEPWFHRSWDKAKAATEQEQLTRLIMKWYERDNPDGARARAEATVVKILGEDEEITGQGSISSLGQRLLNIPNSWSIEDAQFGTIKVSDFIDKRILSVAEHYVKRSAVQIEAAKMYGDSQLRGEKLRIREYLVDRYLKPAVTDRQIARAKARIEEVMGQIDITFRSVAGTLRTTDPLRMDNRIARTMKDFTQLTVAGKIAWNSLSEIMRPGMVNGFGTFYHSLFHKYLDDLEAARGKIEFGGLTGELFDLSMAHNHVQAVTIQDGQPVLGGTALERWISARVPGLYKISGLTSMTTWMKGMMSYSSQHVVMDMAQQVGRAMVAGEQPDPKFLFRLQALGIGPREAILLSQMPTETYRGGKLILPSIDQWKPLGADGRRATALLLNAVHGEMRRGIVTPSVGDRSTVFNGVWTHKGKVVFQSDLMTIPMQFLSYGMGAHNKTWTSMIQGRDRSPIIGMALTYMMAIGAIYLVTPADAWRRRTYDQILAEAFDKSGIGGFWFNGINTSLERATNDQLGLRPSLGIKPNFESDDPNAAISGPLSMLGIAPKHFYDLSRAFWDSSISGSRRAGIVRRMIPYNNVMWWDGILKSMQKDIVDIAVGEN